MSAQLTEEQTLVPVDASVTDHPTLAAALVAAQKEMPAVEKDAVNPHFGSSFTSLGKLIATVRPVLNRNGIAVIQMPSQDEAGKPALVTRLVHSGGESMESTMPLILAKNDAQALGSSLTYAKRYALAAALAIADQEDDDGNAATAAAPVKQPAGPKQVAALREALTQRFGPGPDEAVLASIEAVCDGTVSVEAIKAIAAVMKAQRDFEGQASDQGTGAGAGEDRSPGSSSAPAGSAPSPDPVPAASIEDEIPADREGME